MVLRARSRSPPRLAGRCCAFVRGVKPGEPIASDKASTTELMFTEMHSSALGALSTFLDGYGVPAFANSEQWGRAGPDQRRDRHEMAAEHHWHRRDAVCCAAVSLF